MIESPGVVRPLLAGSLILVGAALAGSSPAPAEAAELPSVRVLAAERSVTVRSFRNRVRLADLGVYVASAGGELRIDVTRPGYGPRRAAQVDGESGAELRKLPRDLVKDWSGLQRFLRVVLRDADGERVRAVTRSFCPNGRVQQRVDDSGPPSPRYNRGCFAGFPFLRGAAWGIDAGWATRPRLGAVRLPPGRYTARVRITNTYRELLEVAPGEATATVRVRVKRGARHGHHVRLAGDRDRAPGDGAPAPLNAPTIDDPDPATLPDLAALPLWGVKAYSRRKRDFLGFASSPWNAGPAPLVIEGYRQGTKDLMEAYQYFVDAAGNVIGRAPAGTMTFHRARGHYHWHFEQFARFSLLERDGGGSVRSRKQSFCIVPTDAVDLTLPGAEWTPSRRGFSSCGDASSIWIRQRLPAGWADTYYQSVAGQAFDITRVPNGRYLLRMRVNPRGEMLEVTSENNTADRVVVLRGKRGARTAVTRPWNGIRK